MPQLAQITFVVITSNAKICPSTPPAALPSSRYSSLVILFLHMLAGDLAEPAGHVEHQTFGARCFVDDLDHAPPLPD